jgi:diguanylate cyclase (GGDEF)-like protein
MHDEPLDAQALRTLFTEYRGPERFYAAWLAGRVPEPLKVRLRAHAAELGLGDDLASLDDPAAPAHHAELIELAGCLAEGPGPEADAPADAAPPGDGRIAPRAFHAYLVGLLSRVGIAPPRGSGAAEEGARWADDLGGAEAVRRFRRLDDLLRDFRGRSAAGTTSALEWSVLFDYPELASRTPAGAYSHRTSFREFLAGRLLHLVRAGCDPRLPPEKRWVSAGGHPAAALARLTEEDLAELAAVLFPAPADRGTFPVPAPAPGARRCSLLVVDDQEHMLNFFRRWRELHGEFEVLTAPSGPAAQEIFARRDVDLILTDRRMPGMTGVQLLEWVRQNHPRTVRMLHTGYDDLDAAVAAINQGQVFRYFSKPYRADELLHGLRQAARWFTLEHSHEQLLEAFRQLHVTLEERVRERSGELLAANLELLQKNQMLEKLALTDPLTDLPNRRAMDRLADREVRRRNRYPGALALGLVDVDHFKQINTVHLHPGGDHVLVELGRVLRGSVRGIDFLGRVGGEEFMVVAPETGHAGAASLAERIRAAVAWHAFTYDGARIRVTVSVGFAVAEVGDVAEYDRLKYVAAAALAEAKRDGRNRCVLRRLDRLGVA